MPTPSETYEPLHLIPARQGVAKAVRRGAVIKVINTHGTQVVDTWAFAAGAPDEHLSMEHTRATMLKIIPGVGDTLFTNHRRPILTVVEDTSGGAHDMLIAACDVYRYETLGAVGYHDNCTDNLNRALAEMDIQINETPSPLNLFMHVPVDDHGRLAFRPPLSQAGQYVCLRAEMDLVIAFSACPQDMVPVNNMSPTEAHFAIFAADRQRHMEES